MPTPLKDPSVRRRRNRTPGARTLSLVHATKAPSLPERTWHPATLDWWRDVWASPMAPEFGKSDTNELFMLAVLVDAFWTEPSQALAAEIRLQRQCFGLTPIDRRRLQWEIDRGEEAEERAAKRKATPKPAAAPRKDPRKLLA